MIATEVTSTNRHHMIVITRHFTPAGVEREMKHRQHIGHGSIDCHLVTLEPHPWGCEQQAKPGKQRAAQGGGKL